MAACVPVIAIVLMISVMLSIQTEPSRFLASAQSCHDESFAKKLADVRAQKSEVDALIHNGASAIWALDNLKFYARVMPGEDEFWDFKRKHPSDLAYIAKGFRQAWSDAQKYSKRFNYFSGLGGNYPVGDPELIAAVERIRNGADDIEKDKKNIQDDVDVNGRLFNTYSESEKILLSRQEKLQNTSLRDIDRWRLLNIPSARDCMPGSIVTSIAEWRMK